MTSRGCLTALVVLAATLTPAFAPTSQAPTLVIHDVTVVDVAGGRLVPNQTVAIAGEAIVNVTPARCANARERVVDGRGKFLIPGLWDMHAHNQASGEESLELYLANGVVGARDMGSDLEFILPLRDRIRRGEVNGPELVAAGPILDDAPPDWPFRRRVRTAQEAREAVRELHKRGVDFVKVHNHTPRDAFFAIADEARKVGLPFAGHVPRTVTIQEGLASDIQSIEHFSESRVSASARESRSHTISSAAGRSSTRSRPSTCGRRPHWLSSAYCRTCSPGNRCHTPGMRAIRSLS